MNNTELYHYGVKGMKWKNHKAKKYENKAKAARESSKEWDEMARYALAKGKTKKAAKYKKYAAEERSEASRYKKAATETKKKSPKAKVNSGKKRCEKVTQKIGRASVKTVGYTAQFGLRMLQNYGNMQRINYWTNS